MPARTLLETVASIAHSIRVGMSGAGPARLLAAYGGISLLVYVETAAFSRSAPFLASLPLIALTVFTICLNIHPQAKFFTTASFIASGLALYLHTAAWASLSLSSLVMTAGNLLYFLSFYLLIREWSVPIAVMLGLYLALFSYICFADLLFSIPTLVCCLFLSVASSSFLVLSAGSLCQHGSLDEATAPQASYIRLVGSLLHVGCLSAAIYNIFAQRSETTIVFARCLEYLAQGLLFLANEREF